MNDILINQKIRARSVRVVDESGNQMGVMEFRAAMIMASNQGLDLIQITGGDIPVCRIGDSGKFIFEKKKTQRENARRQRELQVELKEIQLRPVTDKNDIQVKARKTNEFLADGDKVKVVVRFRGRERANKDVGHRVINDFMAHIVEYKLDRNLVDTGKDISIVLAPLKTKADLKKERQS